MRYGKLKRVSPVEERPVQIKQGEPHGSNTNVRGLDYVKKSSSNSHSDVLPAGIRCPRLTGAKRRGGPADGPAQNRQNQRVEKFLARVLVTHFPIGATFVIKTRGAMDVLGNIDSHGAEELAAFNFVDANAIRGAYLAGIMNRS